MMKRNAAGLLAMATLVLSAGSALAGGFAIREQSAESQGASFAGAAAGTNGLSSMFWNPATMSLHSGQGFVSESNVSIIVPYSEAEDGRPLGAPAPLPAPLNGSGNIGTLAAVPASYWVYGVTDDLTIGASMNSPFGLVTNANNAWYGVAHGDKSDVMTANFNPNVAYRLNDMLSVGLGAQIEYMNVNLTSRVPGAGTQVLDATADDFGVGFTAGILFQPTETTDIGLGFRSSISHKLEGDGYAGPYVGNMRASLKTPETVTLGVRQAVSENFDLLAGVEWANWSRFKDLTLRADPSGAVLGSTPEHWKDSWFFSLGGEYAYSDVLTLRSGVAYEKSPVPDATRTPRLPDNDRLWLSVGASYKLADNMTANLAYSHVFVKDGDVNLPANGPAPAMSASFDQHLDIVSAGLTIDW